MNSNHLAQALRLILQTTDYGAIELVSDLYIIKAQLTNRLLTLNYMIYDELDKGTFN